MFAGVLLGRRGFGFGRGFGWGGGWGGWGGWGGYPWWGGGWGTGGWPWGFDDWDDEFVEPIIVTQPIVRRPVWVVTDFDGFSSQDIEDTGNVNHGDPIVSFESLQLPMDPTKPNLTPTRYGDRHRELEFESMSMSASDILMKDI